MIYNIAVFYIIYRIILLSIEIWKKFYWLTVLDSEPNLSSHQLFYYSSIPSSITSPVSFKNRDTTTGL